MRRKGKRRRRSLYLGLTGTICDGPLYQLMDRLWPLHRKEFEALGYNFRERPQEMLQQYGRFRSVRKVRECEEAGQIVNKVGRWVPEELPGFEPAWMPHLWQSHSFMRMADMLESLPPYTEEMITVDPGELKVPYEALTAQFVDQMKTMREAQKRLDFREKVSLTGAYIQGLITYLERVYEGYDVYYPERKFARTEPMFQGLAFRAPSLTDLFDNSPETVKNPFITAKESVLVNLVAEEARQGRRCCIGYTSSAETDISPRLLWLFDQAGLNVGILQGDNTGNRIRKIEELRKSGVVAFLTNPQKVGTGLDLLWTPTMILYQSPLSSLTLRQFLRRAYRVSQTQPCRSVVLAYAHTWQMVLFTLLKRKLQSALLMEAQAFDFGLADGGDDATASVMKELTRMLVNEDAFKKVMHESETLAESWQNMSSVELDALTFDPNQWVKSIIPFSMDDVTWMSQWNKAMTEEKSRMGQIAMDRQLAKHVMVEQKAIIRPAHDAFNAKFLVEKYTTKKSGKRVKEMVRMSVAEMSKADQIISAQGLLFDL